MVGRKKLTNRNIMCYRQDRRRNNNEKQKGQGCCSDRNDRRFPRRGYHDSDGDIYLPERVSGNLRHNHRGHWRLRNRRFDRKMADGKDLNLAIPKKSLVARSRVFVFRKNVRLN